MLDLIEQCLSDGNWSKLIRTIGCTFNNPDSLLKSFLKVNSPDVSKEDLRAMEVDQDKDLDEKVEEESKESEVTRESDNGAEAMETSSVEQVSQSCDKEDTGSGHSKPRLKEDEVTVDIESVRRTFDKLFSVPGQPFEAALVNALIFLAGTVEIELRYHRAYDREPDYLNIFVILFEIPVLQTEEYIEKATGIICKAAGLLPIAAQCKLARIWSKFGSEKLKALVHCLQQLITMRVLAMQWSRTYCLNDDDAIAGAARVMKILYYACILGGSMDPPEISERERILNEESETNLHELLEGAVGYEPKDKSEPKDDPLGKALGLNPLDCRTPLIKWEDFINEPLSDSIKMDKDYTYYKAEDESKFTFMTHSFLLTTPVKNLGMYFDNRIRMVNERRVSLMQSFIHGAPTLPYLRLRIRRDHIIDDALVNVSMN